MSIWHHEEGIYVALSSLFTIIILSPISLSNAVLFPSDDLIVIMIVTIIVLSPPYLHRRVEDAKSHTLEPRTLSDCG